MFLIEEIQKNKRKKKKKNELYTLHFISSRTIHISNPLFCFVSLLFQMCGVSVVDGLITVHVNVVFTSHCRVTFRQVQCLRLVLYIKVEQ